MKYENASPSKRYPTIIRLDEEELPELTKWKVGGKYKLTLEVEQTSMSKGDEFEDEKKPKVRASFKVISVTPGGTPLKDAKRPNALADAMKKRI